MNNIRRPAVVVALIAIVVGGGGSYAIASAGDSGAPGINTPPDAQPEPVQYINGHLVPPSGLHPVSSHPLLQPATVAAATATLAPGDNQIVTAAEIASQGIPLPFPSDMLTLYSAYFTVRGNDSYGIYTGADASSPSDGMVIVYDQPMVATATPYSSGGLIRLPGSGALTIEGVSGDHATLDDAQGGAHIFDLQTDAFTG
jgi:hypothetical protein